jgi:anaerobic selenocysteine-containing dehydrogenase
MRLSRRTLLGSLGGAAAGAATWSALGQGGPNLERALAEWSNYEEEFHVSICQQCPGGCGILARVVDGNLVRIGGNPVYPVNQGGLCMKGMTGLQMLYDPDRIRTPLEREGGRGSGRWKPIGWKQALEKVVSRLGALRQTGKGHTVALLGGQYRGLVDELFQRFCRAYGTPNYVRLRCLEAERGPSSAYYMHGLRDPLAYDLEHSRYVLSFGCNLLESWVSTVNQQKAYGRLRDRPGGERAKLVVVDPRYSVTAAKADLWLPIQPGTDAALALGLAYIIIQEGRYDTDFVRQETFAFEDWVDESGVTHMGFKTLVLEEYPPEKVAAITGVPVERLFQVARGFAASRPAVALGERGPSFTGNDLYTRMAVHSLNALVGSIGREGGIVRQGALPLKPWPNIPGDAASRAGLAQPRIVRPTGRGPLYKEHDAHRLPRNVLAGDPYELSALLLYYANPLFSQPERESWALALAKIPFIVSFSPFMDETTQQADLILPDCTYLERWRDDEIIHLAGITAFGIGRPVVPPLYDTRASEDVVLQLAHGLGGPVAGALPWWTYGDLLHEKARGLYEAGRGHIVMPPQQEQFEAILARQGYWQPKFDTYEAFWNELLRKGAWWDPNDSYVGPRQLVKTPSHKFEFFSQKLRWELGKEAERLAGGNADEQGKALERLVASLGIQARGDRLFLPHFEAVPREEREEEFPFLLNTYKLMALAGGKGANQPWLQQQPAVHLENGWDSWVEVNPEEAADLGIEDGEEVWLESAKGRIRVAARVFPGTPPRVLNMPYGWGHLAYGRWARNRGQNPNHVLEERVDSLRGLPTYAGTRVRLLKA